MVMQATAKSGAGMLGSVISAILNGGLASTARLLNHSVSAEVDRRNITDLDFLAEGWGAFHSHLGNTC